jgi:hypothetical protein
MLSLLHFAGSSLRIDRRSHLGKLALQRMGPFVVRACRVSPKDGLFVCVIAG